MAKEIVKLIEETCTIKNLRSIKNPIVANVLKKNLSKVIFFTIFKWLNVEFLTRNGSSPAMTGLWSLNIIQEFKMAESDNCNHNCSGCPSAGNCSEKTDFHEKLHEGACVKKVIGVVSGK